jgi:teichuronic acid biosynthesis glycosyltransferase TuaG
MIRENSDVVVSVILPCFNSAEFIDKTIFSVVSQDFLSWELIIIDDFSSDRSVEIVQRYVDSDSRIKLINNTENLGAAVSRNKGLASAKGRFVAFIDSDDQWDESKLSYQITFMQANGIPFCYTNYSIAGVSNDTQLIAVPSSLNRHQILKNNGICTSTVILDTKVFGPVKMPLIRQGQDLALWLKLLRTCTRAQGYDKSLTTYIKRQKSLSSNKLTSAKWVWYLYRYVEKMSFFTASFYFCNYAINGVIKHYQVIKNEKI